MNLYGNAISKLFTLKINFPRIIFESTKIWKSTIAIFYDQVHTYVSTCIYYKSHGLFVSCLNNSSIITH